MINTHSELLGTLSGTIVSFEREIRIFHHVRATHKRVGLYYILNHLHVVWYISMCIVLSAYTRSITIDPYVFVSNIFTIKLQ